MLEDFLYPVVSNDWLLAMTNPLKGGSGEDEYWHEMASWLGYCNLAELSGHIVVKDTIRVCPVDKEKIVS